MNSQKPFCTVTGMCIPTRSFRSASCVATTSDVPSASEELSLSELTEVDWLPTLSPFPLSTFCWGMEQCSASWGTFRYLASKTSCQHKCRSNHVQHVHISLWAVLNELIWCPSDALDQSQLKLILFYCSNITANTIKTCYITQLLRVILL